MRTRTEFLGRLIGWYCLISGSSLMWRKESGIALIRALIENPRELFLAGLISLLAGLSIVLAHNHWSGGTLEILVTVTGWVTLGKGVLLLLLTPEHAETLLLGTLVYEQLFWFYTALSLILGAALLVLSAAPYRTDWLISRTSGIRTGKHS